MTRVLTGTYRIIDFSREHVRLTGPYALRLQRRSGHRGRVGSGHLKLIHRSLAQTTQMLIVNEHGMKPT